MSPPSAARAEGPPLLRALDDEGLPFVLIGSLALACTAPALLDREPGDVDLLVPFELPTLERLLVALERRGFSWRSWQDPVARPLTRARLAGRFYLRATSPTGLILDATYESPLPFPNALARASRAPGFPVASLADLSLLASARAGSRDSEVRIKA